MISSLALLPAVWLAETHGGIALVIILAIAAWQFAYLATALRRVYHVDAVGLTRARLWSIAMAVLIYLLNSAFITVVPMVGGAIALRGI